MHLPRRHDGGREFNAWSLRKLHHTGSIDGSDIRIASQQRLLLDDSIADNATAGFEKLIMVTAADATG